MARSRKVDDGVSNDERERAFNSSPSFARNGGVDDGVSSDEEELFGFGGGGDSSLRSLSPGALDRRLEERLMAMERVTQAAVKHTADLEMMLALTRTNLQVRAHAVGLIERPLHSAHRVITAPA